MFGGGSQRAVSAPRSSRKSRGQHGPEHGIVAASGSVGRTSCDVMKALLSPGRTCPGQEIMEGTRISPS